MSRKNKNDLEIEITEAMIDAGEERILFVTGGSTDLSGFFSARELAKEVFLAMTQIKPLPIDTAPRDGTRIMIFDGEKQLWGFGSWAPGEDIEEPFTHWMPSPEPPFSPKPAVSQGSDR